MASAGLSIEGKPLGLVCVACRVRVSISNVVVGVRGKWYCGVVSFAFWYECVIREW